MPMIFSLALLLAVGAEPAETPPAAVLAPVRVATSQASRTNPAPLPADPAVEKIRHLELAAEHLQAAGLSAEAELVRKRAGSERDSLNRQIMAAKRQQLIALRKQIADLTFNADEAGNRNIMMRVALLEVSKTGWQESLEPVLAENISHKLDTDDDYEAIIFHGSEEWRLAVEALATKQQAKRLAAPTLATLNGVECAIHTGGRVPAVVDVDGESVLKQQPFGVQVRIRPQLGKDGQITLAVSAQYDAAVADAGNVIKGVTPFVIEDRFHAKVKAAMKRGEGLAIVSPVTTTKPEADESGEVAVRTILVIYPEAMKPVAVQKNPIRR